MFTYTIDEPRTTLTITELLHLLETHTEIMLLQHEQPIAKLVAIRPQKRVAGLHMGAIHITNDFDDSLESLFGVGLDE